MPAGTSRARSIRFAASSAYFSSAVPPWSLRCRVDDATEDVTLDELLLSPRGLLERGGGEAVDVAQGTRGGLVQHRHCVGPEQLAVAASALQAYAQILGGVLG